ncbi:RNA polymerase, sigma 54 subunit, RpoN/SigL [Halobacillus dabanensis]|uniref:RNA polymerase, sigma 54 subunit, RpoN/SigL n=1 Tax=Halobacillus dabanensis TaxID=240302 RepID=A0A1I3WLJ1_HALDA|nr:RNA polymerase factor sigma-54 [Halobacillus dabanensis]SFK08013.1 RNA polymerase, sigma 54 subunit, RpoN/SigL [Halobacillus dabanensis]
MKLELSQKQTTGLLMTAEMRQAITMLQWSSADLWNRVQREVNENPILTLDSPGNFPTFRGNREAYQDQIDKIAHEHKGWRDSLVEQAGYLKISPSLKEVLLFLIGNLDGRGFCKISEEEAADQLGVPVSKVTHARRLLLQFEPFGVGCYDFKEFLMLQIEGQYPDSSLLGILVSYHLEELAEGNFGKVAQALEVEDNRVEDAFNLIKTLEPRPLLSTDDTDVLPVMPDLILEKGEGGYLLHDPLSISKQIKWDEPLLKMYEQGQEAYEYLDGCYKRARWLFQCIEQRRKTVLLVAEAIIKHQKRFLNGGSLKPLTLKDIAETIGLHESTVSRAVANKVIQTPDGIIEMKSFFITGYKTSQGAEYSSQHIKEWIKTLIYEENPLKALSDQKISSELHAKYNVKISRRTIAKYRESLNLPSSSKRKAAARDNVVLSGLLHS